jgi:MFS family permease
MWRWRIARETVGFVLAVLLCVEFVSRVEMDSAPGVPLYRPYPDAVEHAWVTQAFAHGRSPLMPLANELHPSRFSPIHPLMASLSLRLGEGEFTGLLWHSSAALVLGCLLIHGWLGVVGLSLTARIVALLAILRLPMMVTVGRNIMQEPSMLLLFGVGGLAWALAMQSLGRPRRRVIGMVSMALAGAALAALLCIRPPTAPMLVLVALHVVMTLGWRGALAPLIALGLGAAGVIVATALYVHHVAGLWDVTAYHHWIPGFTGLSWSQPGRPPLNGDSLPMGIMILSEVFGISTRLTAAGILSPVLALLGVALLIPRGLSWPGRLPMALLFAFALSQLGFHLFYQHLEVRFFILAFPALLIAGAAGWDAALRAWWRRGQWRSLAALVALLVAIGLVGIPWPTRSAFVSTWDRREVMAHRRNASVVRHLDCPLLVHRMSVLSARLLLDLSDWPHVIAPFQVHLRLDLDGHTPQFRMSDVGPPRGHLGDPSLWPEDPHFSGLIDHDLEMIGGEQAERLLERHGRFAIYTPTWMEWQIGNLRGWALERGLTLRDISRDRRWCLIVVEPPPDPA